MSQAPCDRSDFPLSMRWAHSSGDLSRPHHIHQCAVRPLMCPKGASECPAQTPELPLLQTFCQRRAGVPPPVNIGASAKSP